MMRELYALQPGGPQNTRKSTLWQDLLLNYPMQRNLKRKNVVP